MALDAAGLGVTAEQHGALLGTTARDAWEGQQKYII
eukprot:COSAG06_NODE_1087_length_10749_cov_1130.191174_3_plen_36_part_00